MMKLSQTSLVSSSFYSEAKKYKKNPEYIEPDEYKMFDANHETIKL